MTNSNISTLFAESLNDLKLSGKQRAVLRASLTLFSEKGFENTSTLDIARMAGVAEGTVYQQFKTKAGLLSAVLTAVIDRVIPKVASEFVNGIDDKQNLNFEDFLQNIIQNRMQFVVDNLPQIRILLRESLVNDKVRVQVDNELKKLPFDKLALFFENYSRQGQIVDWDSMRIIRYIIGITGSYLFPVIFGIEKSFSVTKASQEAAEFLVNGLKA